MLAASKRSIFLTPKYLIKFGLLLLFICIESVGYYKKYFVKSYLELKENFKQIPCPVHMVTWIPTQNQHIVVVLRLVI